MSGSESNADGGGKKEPRYDLEERTAKFGEAIIRFAKTIPVNLITTPLIGQIVRSATSVGANYGEADDRTAKRNSDTAFRFPNESHEKQSTGCVRSSPPNRD